MKVSIVCLTYNHENYIRDALESFVRQKTNFDYEVIVHDDASTDQTAKVIEEYAQRYPDLFKPILQTENQYSQGTDILGDIIWPKCSGQYVAMCEGDDYWIDENKLQMQIDFLDQNPQYSACVHNSYMLDMRTSKKTVMFTDADHDIDTVPVIKYGNSTHYQTASLVFRSEYLENLPAFMEFGIDYTIAIYLSLKGPIHFLGRIMSVYRFGTAGSFTMMTRKDMHQHALHCKQLNNMLQGVNEYTNFAYRELIEERILENNYHALRYSGNYSEMRKPEYRSLYRRESLASRFKMRLKQYFTPLYHVYRKLKY